MRWKLVILLLTALLWAGSVRAEPYLAVREGLKCSACHVNITGGGKRTPIVNAHARDILHYPDFFAPLTRPVEPFSGELHPRVAIGANLRASNTAIFQDEPDETGRVSNNTVFRDRLETNELDVTEAVGYLEVRLIPDWLTFYVDQRFAPQTDTREVFGLLWLPGEVFFKAGRMFLPYGLQIQDDTAFIRGGRNGSASSGFSFEQQQASFEAGWEPGPFSLIGAVSEGAPRDRDVRVTGTVYGLFTDLPAVRTVLIGGSGSRVGPPGVQSHVFGFFAGTNFGPFTYLGEVDFRSDESSATGGEAEGTFLHYSELNYLLLDWLNIKAAFDYADDDGDLSRRANDSENRFSVGLEPFLSRFLQARLFYRVSNGVRTRPDHNQDLWIAEVHLFF